MLDQYIPHTATESHEANIFEGQQLLRRFQQIGEIPVIDELPKTGDQEYAIAVAQAMVSKEMALLDVHGPILEGNRIHFVDRATFQRDFTPATSDVIYSPFSHSVIVGANLDTKSDLLRTMSEELLHAASYREFLYSPSNKTRLVGGRTGYHVSGGTAPQLPNEPRVQFFHGVSEGITNILKREMVVRNADHLARTFSLSTLERDTLLDHDDYAVYRSAVTSVMQDISRITGFRYEDVERIGKEGLFKQDPHFYGLITDIYGKEGFAMLSYLGMLGYNHPLDEAIKGYFTTTGVEKRRYAVVAQAMVAERLQFGRTIRREDAVTIFPE